MADAIRSMPAIRKKCEQNIVTKFMYSQLWADVTKASYLDLSQWSMPPRLGITTSRLTSHGELMVHAGCGAAR